MKHIFIAVALNHIFVKNTSYKLNRLWTTDIFNIKVIESIDNKKLLSMLSITFMLKISVWPYHTVPIRPDQFGNQVWHHDSISLSNFERLRPILRPIEVSFNGNLNTE